jgi:hypothetical protein
MVFASIPTMAGIILEGVIRRKSGLQETRDLGVGEELK